MSMDSNEEKSFGHEPSQSKFLRHLKTCAVPGCRTRGGQMFVFPANLNSRELWRSRCKIVRPLKKYTYACRRHFNPNDFVSSEFCTRLKPEALPSLFLPEVEELPLSKMFPCAVSGCSSSSKDGVTLHSFPRDLDRLSEWKALCGLVTATRRTVICSDHFVESDFLCKRGNSKKTLRKGVLPSKNLPRKVSKIQRSTVCSMSVGGGVYNDNLSDGICNNSTTASELESALESIISLNETEEHSCTSDEGYSELDDSFDSVMQHVVKDMESLLSIVSSSICTEHLRKVLNDEFFQSLPSFFGFCEPKSDSAFFKRKLLETVPVDNIKRETQIMTDPKFNNMCLNDETSNPNKKSDQFNFRNLLECGFDLKVLAGINLVTLNCICNMVDSVQSDVENVEQGLLPLKDKIVLTLCKLRLNLCFVTLAYLFKIDLRTCCLYFEHTVSLLAIALKPLNYWPSKEEVEMNMPKCFSSFRSTRVVLHCIEIPVAKPVCLICRARMYSHKGRHTVKFLIGCAPHGLITFVSKAYGGKASDKAIFEESELLADQLLEPDKDAVMVDQELRIDSACDAKLIKVICPPLSRERERCEKADADLTTQIINARVHVDRAIQMVKQFRILQTELSLSLVPHFNAIICVIAALVNVSSPNVSDCF